MSRGELLKTSAVKETRESLILYNVTEDNKSPIHKMQNDVTLHVIKQVGWFFTFVKNKKDGNLH